MGIRQLKFLTDDAKKLFFEKMHDGYSFADFMNKEHLSLVGARRNKTLDLNDLKSCFGKDNIAPKDTKCVFCLVNLIFDRAEDKYKDDKNLQKIIRLYDKLNTLLKESSSREIFPTEIIKAQKEIEAFIKSLTKEELYSVHGKFSKIYEEVIASEANNSFFVPRYKAKIQAREKDLCLGEITTKEGKRQYIGSFVIVEVNHHSVFKMIVFVLGLKPGSHILGACGNPNQYDNHLYQLRNFRFNTPRQESGSRHWWNLLPAKMYKESLLKVERLQKDKLNLASLEEMWEKAKNSEIKGYEEMWVEGEALKPYLDYPNSNFSHTVRGLAIRKSPLSSKWEVLMVFELGDAKKFPAWGVPGGTVDFNETVGKTILRETKNECIFGRVDKINALIAKIKKTKLPGREKENYDYWFFIEMESKEVCPTSKLIESNEIKADSCRWVPLEELATFTSQNSKNPIRNIETVFKNKMMYLGQALVMSKNIPRIPGVILPDNFEEFKKNIKKFREFTQQ